MRLFVAVNFNNDTRSSLLGLRDELRSRSERGNFSLPENLHLTLAFLGECDTKQFESAKSAMAAVLFHPFDVRIERIGKFRRDRGDLWWAGLHGSKPLLDLQRDLTERLIAAGFTLEKRDYKPHITLGREVFTDAVPWRIDPFGERTSGIDLMLSERVSGVLTYTAIYTKKAEHS